jgi:hypothetical protein
MRELYLAVNTRVLYAGIMGAAVVVLAAFAIF